MFLSSVKIENFRTYKNSTIDFIEPFTSIIGPNGSGKSNIISAFLFAITDIKEEGCVTLCFSDFTIRKSSDGKINRYFLNEREIQKNFYFNYLHDKKVDVNMVVQQRGVDMAAVVENMLCITDLSNKYNNLNKERIKINKILKKFNLQCALKKYNEYCLAIKKKKNAIEKIFLHKKRREYEEHKNKNIILKDRLQDEIKILNILEQKYKNTDMIDIVQVRREQDQLRLELTSIANLIFTKYGEGALISNRDLSTANFKSGNVFLFKKYAKKKEFKIENLFKKYFAILQRENEKINLNLKKDFLRATAELKNMEEERGKFNSYIRTIREQLNALPFQESDLSEIETFFKKSKIGKLEKTPFYERIQKYEQILFDLSIDYVEEKNSILNLIKFKSKYSAIISAALGKNINALIVDSRSEAFDLYKQYKSIYKNKNCSIIIYDLESFTEKINYAETELNPVFELISCEKKYENLMKFLLKDIFYAENLNCITDFYFKKIISMNGDVLHFSGIYSSCLPRPPKAIINHFLKNIFEIKGRYKQFENLTFRLTEYSSIEKDLSHKIELTNKYIVSLNYNGEEGESLKDFIEKYFIEGVSKTLLREIFTENFEYDELKIRIEDIKRKYDNLKNIKEEGENEKMVEEINLLIEKTNNLKQEIIDGQKKIDDLEIEEIPLIDLGEQYEIIRDFKVFEDLQENFPRKFKMTHKKLILKNEHDITHNYLIQYKEYINALHNIINDEILKHVPPTDNFSENNIKKYEERIKILNNDIKECGRSRHEIVFNFFSSFTSELKNALKILIGDFSDISLKYLNKLRILVKMEEKNFIEYKNLSGGEQQLIMVVFICAILKIQKYKLVIFDEVDGFLDGSNLERLADFFKQVFKLFNLQLIVISHKNETFKESDALVGVYKKLESAILTLKL